MILLDSHVLVWFYLGGDRLGRVARKTIERYAAAASIAVCPVSFFEIEAAAGRGRLKGLSSAQPMRLSILAAGVHEVPIDGAVCLRAAELRAALADPFDALIHATADVHGHDLLTADERMLAWKGRVKRIDARK